MEENGRLKSAEQVLLAQVSNVCVCACVCAFVQMCMYMYVCVCMYLCVFVCACMCACVCEFMYMYTHVQHITQFKHQLPSNTEHCDLNHRSKHIKMTSSVRERTGRELMLRSRKCKRRLTPWTISWICLWVVCVCVCVCVCVLRGSTVPSMCWKWRAQKHSGLTHNFQKIPQKRSCTYCSS